MAILNPPTTGSLLLLACLLVSPAPSLAGGGAKRSDLQGHWKLNEDLTARLRQSDQASNSGQMRFSSPGDMRRPGGRGMPSAQGSRSGPRRPENSGGPSFHGLDELTIVQTETAVTLTDQEGRQRVLPTNGKKFRLEDAPGEPAELRASWEDGNLVVKVKPDGGPRRTETYLVSNDRKLLYLIVTIDPGVSTPEIRTRRAYDAVPEDGAGYKLQK